MAFPSAFYFSAEKGVQADHNEQAPEGGDAREDKSDTHHAEKGKHHNELVAVAGIRCAGPERRA